MVGKKTFPLGNNYPVSTEFNQTTSQLNFGFRAAGTVEGIKWNDVNNDGIKSNNEPGFSGQLIYLDQNQNGQLDAGETSTTTDDNGFYSFEGLTPGNYTISEVVDVGWQSTLPKYLEPKTGTLNVTYDELFPNEAKAAFEQAADIWESLLVTNVPLDIQVGWSSFPAGLANGGPGGFVTNFDNIPEPNVFYPVGLANQLAGSDLKPNEPDIYVTIDSEQNWYLGTDGQTSSSYDLVTVALHEIAHGLGFFTLLSHSPGSGIGSYTSRFIYDKFLVNGSGESLYNHQLFPNNSTALGEQLVSQNLFFDGDNAQQANGGNSVKIYAPSSYDVSSSLSHLDNLSYRQRNAIMTPTYNQGVIHNPDDIMLGILEDLGWTINNSSPSSPRSYTVSLSAGDIISDINFSNVRINNVPVVEADKNIVLEPNTSIALNIDPPTDADGDNLLIITDNIPDGSFGEIQRPDGTIVNVGNILSLNDLTALSFVANGSLTGIETFGYTVSDGVNTASSTVTLSLNQPPLVEGPKTLNPDEDITINLNITAPSDPENDPLEITVDTLPHSTKGELQKFDGSPVAVGDMLTSEELTSLQFVPVPDANGNAGNFGYTVDDGNNNPVSSSVSFDITPVDDAPVVVNEISDVSIYQDADNTIIDLSDIFADIDNDDHAITKSVFSNDNTSLVTATIVDQQLILDYQDNQSGTATITIEGLSNGQSAFDSFDVTVNQIITGAPLNLGEADTITLDHNLQTITLDHTYNNPIIFAPSVSYNGNQLATPRITNITNNSFDIYLQEPVNEDGTHILETLSYFVFEAGTYQLSDGTLVEVGSFDTDATANVQNLSLTPWQTVEFDIDFADTPVIFSQVQTLNDSNLVRTRQQNATANGFDVVLEEDEVYGRNAEGHSHETIGYVAIASGNGNSNGVSFQAGSTGNTVTHELFNINFGDQFTEIPHFLANIATYDGPDASALRFQNLTSNGVEVTVQEDITFDTETNHTTEVVNYLAVGGNNGWQGTAYDPLTGNRAIVGTDADEYILGIAENDTRTGQGGSDIFVLKSNQGTDTITDFELGVDSIGLSGGLSYNQLALDSLGENTLISYNNQALLVLNGVNSNHLTNNDFVEVTI
ncbi:SdrD B-like domain-containing protein [Cyanothece sp. BG0011]|uniref:SdrD B-like domain-containing protein n=1 Tax=Cyanothece sp. BG0011 TaxID=2082950 RepID=UPI0018E4E3D1|nr:SdrD B-like domain-containing protein [Cyanothece sp. BG0011]